MKNKETLEEAAKKYIGFPLDKDIDEEQRYFNPNVKKYDAFIEGAKWAQERSFSEEDLMNFGAFVRIEDRKEKRLFLIQDYFKKWFNKFKKK